MGYNILIVDDSKTIRAILSKTMRLTGISISEIIEAGNGREALECLHGQWIDLVLTDLNMPVMTGIELIEAMVADDLLKNVPVVVISTDGSTTRIEELKAKGVREYIQKPFTPEGVRGIIETLLGVLHE